MPPAVWVPTEHVQQVSLEEQVLKGLRGRILRGEIPPGSQLSTRQVAEAYGVSAMPVRMALKQLEVEGLVRISPQRYVEVTGLTIEQLMDVNRIRSVLEALAVRLSSEKARSSPSETRRQWLLDARHAFHQLQQADEAGNVAGFVKHHNDFHLILDAHNDNARLLKEILRVYDYIAYFREIVFNMPVKRAASMKEHRAILEAVEADDTELAERLTRSHIENLEHHLDELRRAASGHDH